MAVRSVAGTVEGVMRLNPKDPLATVAFETIQYPEMTLKYDEWLAAQEPAYQERVLASRVQPS